MVWATFHECQESVVRPVDFSGKKSGPQDQGFSLSGVVLSCTFIQSGREYAGMSGCRAALKSGINSMADALIENPILNSPFFEPDRHFKFTDEGISNEIVDRRRYRQPVANEKGGRE